MRAKNTSRVTDKRKYIRLKSILPVEFRIAPRGRNLSVGAAGSSWQQGYTCNVSEGGVCVETAHLDEAVLKQVGKPNVEVEVSMRIPLHRPPVMAGAKIIWFRHLDSFRPIGSSPQAERLPVGGTSGLREENAPHYMLGLQFTDIAYGDCDRLLSQARVLSLSTHLLTLTVIVLLLGFVIVGFYNYRLRMDNEKLVDYLARAQQEEIRIRETIGEIDREKEMLSAQMKKYADGISGRQQLSNEYDQLVARETRIADRLRLLERQKSDMRQTVVERMHQWLKNHQNPLTGLILSFEGDVGIIQDWAFIYDQALAVNTFLLFDDERDARRVLNFFKRTLPENFQGFPNAYYYDSGDIAEYTVHCGPNIWVGIGVLQYTHKTKDDYYLPVARAIADWLITIQEKDPEGGLKGGPEFSWFATEHNLDAYAFFGMMHELTKEEKYNTAQKKILSWLKTYAMIPHGKDYQSPPVNRGRGDATIATDTFAWSLAAIGPEKLRQLGMDPEEIMNFAEEHCAVTVPFTRPSGVKLEVTGFDFAKHANMPRGGMISPEWTSQMIVSYQILSRYFSQKERLNQAHYYAEKARSYLGELNKLIIASPSVKGQGEGCLPYATLENADTGHGWSTPLGTKTCSVAGTAYMIMAIKQFNPLVLD